MTTNTAAPIRRIAGMSEPVGTYSPGVAARGFLFVSGQASFDENGEFVDGTFREKAEQTLANLERVAVNAGTSLKRAVKLGVFISSDDYRAKWAIWNDVCREVLGDPFPARTALPADLGDLEIEVDGIFLLGDPAEESEVAGA